MDGATLIGFSLFATITAFTPGPNNLMLAASGANYGLRRTLPHILGITAGFLSLVISGNLGLSALFTTFPIILELARWLCGLFLLYITYKIATAAPPEGVKADTRPVNFITAMLFQIVNPKALVVIATSVSVYAGRADNLYLATFIITIIFAVVTIASTIMWTYGGVLFGRWLKDRKKLRIFNFTMAGLILASLLPVILHI